MLTTLQAEHSGQKDAKVPQCIKHLYSALKGIEQHLHCTARVRNILGQKKKVKSMKMRLSALMPSLVEVKEKGMCAVCYNVYTSRNTWRLIAILHFSADKRYILSKYSSVKFHSDSGKKLSFVVKTARFLNLKDILL